MTKKICILLYINYVYLLTYLACFMYIYIVHTLNLKFFVCFFMYLFEFRVPNTAQNLILSAACIPNAMENMLESYAHARTS